MKVSIVTPTKNPNPCYLSSCINSVQSQKDYHVEHIFVDGGSDNGTMEFLVKYQSLFPDKVKVIQEHDKSAGEAWVNGMKIASGDILGFLGADDTLEPNAIRTVVSFFTENQKESFVFGGCNRIDGEGNLINRMITKEFYLHDAINNYCSIPATSAFYRREVIDKVSPDVIARNDGELEWWLMVGKKFKMNRIYPILSNFRVYPDKARKDGFFTYASTVWSINRRYGAGIFSPCAIRYYLALMTYPISPILNPIFIYMTHEK